MTDPNPATPRPVAVKAAERWFTRPAQGRAADKAYRDVLRLIKWDRTKLAEHIDAAITADPLLSAAGELKQRVAELDAGRLELLERLGDRLGDSAELAYALMSEAMARGVARWHEQTGRTEVKPDTATLSAWLLDDMEKTKQAAGEMAEALVAARDKLVRWGAVSADECLQQVNTALKRAGIE